MKKGDKDKEITEPEKESMKTSEESKSTEQDTKEDQEKIKDTDQEKQETTENETQEGEKSMEQKQESTSEETIRKDEETSESVQMARAVKLEEKGVDRYWVPRTNLGKMVRDGNITTMEEVLNSGLVLREPEIVDILLGDMQDEVIDVNMVQRMTDSGRRVRFAVTVAVGNENGYLGLGRAHGREVGPTIRKAIDNAKLNIISLHRGCGSWECGCGAPHSIPFRTSGKSGSVKVTFYPAPKGVGLAAGDVAKKILKLGGIKDLWANTKGQTQTTINYATAVYEALVGLSKMRMNEHQQEKFRIRTGGIEE